MDIRLGIVRGISYGLFGKPDAFVAQARDLGAGLVRVYFYWSQIEPEPGRFVWDAVDAFLEQLDGSEEVWITVCSSSPWATRQATQFLPPSPARDQDAYYQFVHQLVTHCGGRVHYWQCENEPSNTPLLWAGTAAEYVDHLHVLYRAVKDADPHAAVVLGGAPYGLPASDEQSEERRFFQHLLREGRDFFDLFDIHLYGDVTRIPADIEAVRQMMRALGYEKPVVAGECNGPGPYLYPDAMAALQEVMAAVFADPSAASSSERVKALATQQNPERTAMAALYDRMLSLPPSLQMFMDGCPPELEDKRHRINCRELVIRNLLALGAGVRRIACWNLAPEVPGFNDPYSVMNLLFAKLKLMDYEGAVLRHRYPAAESFRLLTEQLAGAETVTRVYVPDRPALALIEVERSGRGPLLVVWDQRNSFDSETAPFDWPWIAPDATAVDALGQLTQQVDVRDGRLRVSVSSTPLFIAATQFREGAA